MIIVKPEKIEKIVPRMLELTSRITPWHRRNWRAGALEIAEEALRELQIPGTHESARKQIRTQVLRSLGGDPGVSKEQRAAFNEFLKTIDPSSGGKNYGVCLGERYVKDLRNAYLLNWADVFDSTDKASEHDAEGVAKRLISHLLYCGMSASSIYTIIKDHQVDAEEHEFSSLLRELDKRAKRSFKDFTFAIPVDSRPYFFGSGETPDFQDRYPGWLTAKQLKVWKHRNAPNAKLSGKDTKSLRYHGGFLYSVKARDVNEAADRVQRLLPQLNIKFQSQPKAPFSICPIMWSKEKGTAFATQKTSEPLKLHAFKRAEALHYLVVDAKARNILAIAEPLQTHDSHVAIVNGWVAIESLLVGPNEEDLLGAHRMAQVVAASYFRTEMTWLAREYSEKYKDKCSLAKAISNSETSIDRCKLMEKAIWEGKSFDELSQVDQLGIEKMQHALAEPKKIFDRTHEILHYEFLRLYRKRNLIVHSGRVVENGIESVADKIVPLLINGIDQILIALLQHATDPKELAASIEYKANHLGGGQNLPKFSILDLLEINKDVDEQ